MRKFLKKNEIYFSTLSSLLLGIMAIIVSYNSNRISKEQSKMNYFENSPDFHFSREYLTDSTGYANGIDIQLNKSRGKAKNIKVKIECYAHFEIMNQNSHEINRYIHLMDYFESSYNTGKNKGNIKLIRGLNNLKNFSKFEEAIEHELTEKNYTSVFINNLLIAKITYTDFLNEIKEEYYDVSYGEGILLEENDFRVDLFNNLKISPKSISIADFNLDNIKSCMEIIENNS